MYLDSTWYGLRPDCDQFVASQLRESLEGLLERYQVLRGWWVETRKRCSVFAAWGACLLHAAAAAHPPFHISAMQTLPAHSLALPGGQLG